jgi:DNA-binding CsgD family transcriptional regulator
MIADDLIGREAPLAALSAAIAAAGDHGDAIMLAGERGIGKTACVLAAQQVAQAAGRLVVCAVGSAAESALPFAGLHRLLQPFLPMADALPLVQRRGLLRALGMQDGPPPDLFVVSLATLNLVDEATKDGSLLMTVDDLQWLDEESRHVLDFAARRLDRRRVVIIATSSRIPELDDAFRQVPLTRLDDAAARLLLKQCVPDLDQAHRDWVVSHAAGNPLALTELAAMPIADCGQRTDPFSTISPISPVLERAFADRLHELPRISRDAVLIAALAYDDSLQEALAATALLGGQQVTTAVLESPQALGLLRYDETRVYFAHPLVKSAVAQSESLGRRQAAHWALGETVVVNSYRRVWHRANGAAGCDESVAAELEANSAISIGRGDTAAAIMALERAAQLSTASAERGRRLLLAAKQAAGMRLLDTVDRLLASADSEELSSLDRIRADLMRNERGDAAVGDSNRIVYLCAAARQAAATGETGLAMELAYAAGIRRYAAHVSSRAVFALTSLAETLARGRADPGAIALLALADPVRQGRRVMSLLADAPDEDATDAGSLAALGTLAGAAYAVGDYPRGAVLEDRAEAALRRLGLRDGMVPLLCGGAEIRLDLGEWHRADAALAEAGAMIADSDRTVYRPHVLSTAAKAAALRGDAATALELIVEAEHCPAVRRGSSILTRAQTARGIAYISSGRYLDAYTLLSRVFDPKDPSHHFREQFGAVMYLAEAAVRSGQHDGARAIVARMEVTAQCSGSPLLVTQLRYARAVLAPDDTAEQLFLDCLAADLSSWPWPRARVQLAYGRWLRRQRQVRRSRVPLQAALSALQSLGAASWAREALDELEAAGRSSEDRPAEFSAVLLSAQELKIARLAARGLSNTEIGEQLGLSRRTVGSHLYRIFPKLDISARGQLATRLAE